MMTRSVILFFVILLAAPPVFAKTIYVDTGSIGGTCSDARTYAENSETTPWCTLDEAFYDGTHTYAAGDEIVIREYTYTGSVWLRMRDTSITWNGTLQNRVKIRPYSGETVTIEDGSECIIAVSGSNIDYVHLEADYDGGQIKCWETAYGFRTESSANTYQSWIIEGLHVDSNYANGKIGINMHGMKDPLVKDCIVENQYKDGEAVGYGVRDGTTTPTFENCIARNINDGRGKSGDGDGFWGEGSGQTALPTDINIINCTCQNVSEDCYDFKASGTHYYRNSTAINSLTVGVKFWYGDIDVAGLFVAGSGEDGLKMSNVTGGIMTNVTSVENGESGLQTRDNPNVFSVVDSIFYNNGESAVDITDPGAGETTDIDFLRTLLDNGQGTYAVSNTACSGASWTNTEVTDGTFNTDLVNTQSCSNGTIMGTATTMYSENPDLTQLVGHPDVWTHSDGVSTTTSIPTEDNVDYPWSGLHGVGDEIEIDNDGVFRELTAVSDPTLTFANDAMSGSVPDGVTIKNWGASPPSTTTWDATPTGFGIDQAVYNASVHCSEAGVTGECVTWYGSAPDIGYGQLEVQSDSSLLKGVSVSGGSL